MLRRALIATLVAGIAAVVASPARAQYVYPRGYAGWGGWGGGGSTVAGDAARGMGAFAAGAGAYNVQTSQARAVNTNTAMQLNEYLYQGQMQRNIRYYNELASKRQKTNASADQIYQRLRNNPNLGDIRSGDALNVVLDEVTDPKVYTKAVQAASQPVPSDLVKNINFQYAAAAIAISLDQLTANGVPDVLRTDPRYEENRKAFRAVVEQARTESSEQGRVSPRTLAEARKIIKETQDKVAMAIPAGSRERRETDNYLKALYGLTKMLEMPDVGQFLRGLNQYPTTTLGHLLTFMHTFNLRFGAANSPAQNAAYDQLYPLLVALRDQVVQPSQATSPLAAAPPDPNKAKAFFSGMEYEHFQPQPSPHGGPAPAPPPPGSPR